MITKYTKEAVDNALINLEAEAAPAGSMTVVLLWMAWYSSS